MANEDKTNLHSVDIVRASKDEEYRNSLTPEQLAQLPLESAGESELSEEALDDVSGGLTLGLRKSSGGNVSGKIYLMFHF